jgi:hypothetical protein
MEMKFFATMITKLIIKMADVRMESLDSPRLTSTHLDSPRITASQHHSRVLSGT